MDVIEMGFLSFKYESASAMIDFLSIDMGMVTNIISEMRNLGDGTGLMKAICEFADENDMQLVLYVGADEEIEDGLNDEQLISWYQKFGFKPGLIGPNSDWAPKMVRQPVREQLGNWTYEEDYLPEENDDGTS